MLRAFKAGFPDLARANRYEIRIPGLSAELAKLCVIANMPGETYSSNPNYDPQPGTNVIPWELPYDITQNECQLTFSMDADFAIRRYFDDWRKEVFDSTRGFGYMEDFVKNVSIIQKNRQNVPIYTTILTNAWPKSLADTNFDASQNNTPTAMVISLVYGGQIPG